MSIIKKSVISFIILTFVLTLVVSGLALAKDKDLSFYFVAPKTDDPIWLVAKEGFDAAAEDFGFEAVWTGGSNHTVEGTISALESSIAVQPNGIVACPIAPAAFTSSLKKAKKYDIPVISVILKPISEDLRTAWIGTDFSKAGLLSIKEIHKTLGNDDINLAVVMSNMDVQIQIDQYKASEKYMEDLEDAERVEIVEDHADPNEAYTQISNLLRAHPEINAIQSTESGGTPGVGKAIHDLGLTDEIVAVCSDDTSINLDTIRKGWIHGVTAQDFWAMGYLAGRYLYMQNNGLKVPDKTDSGIILVTKENIDNYNEIRAEKHKKWREEADEIIEKAQNN